MSDKTTLLNPLSGIIQSNGTITLSGSLQVTNTGTIFTVSSGTVGFGTFTTSAGKVFAATDGISGYITIIDSNGTSRKIAILG